ANLVGKNWPTGPWSGWKVCLDAASRARRLVSAAYGARACLPSGPFSGVWHALLVLPKCRYPVFPVWCDCPFPLAGCAGGAGDCSSLETEMAKGCVDIRGRWLSSPFGAARHDGRRLRSPCFDVSFL